MASIILIQPLFALFDRLQIEVDPYTRLICTSAVFTAFAFGEYGLCTFLRSPMRASQNGDCLPRKLGQSINRVVYRDWVDHHGNYSGSNEPRILEPRADNNAVIARRTVELPTFWTRRHATKSWAPVGSKSWNDASPNAALQYGHSLDDNHAFNSDVRM